MRSLGRLDFIVRQKNKTLLKIFYLEGLDLWFKKASETVTPLSKEQAMHLISVWQANHEKANARISGGLIPYLESEQYKAQVQRVQELNKNKEIIISSVVA